MEIRIKTTCETIEPGIWCALPTLLLYKCARGMAFGVAWLKWCGLLAIIVPNAKKRQEPKNN